MIRLNYKTPAKQGFGVIFGMRSFVPKMSKGQFLDQCRTFDYSKLTGKNQI
jgi:hypothetical protein